MEYQDVQAMKNIAYVFSQSVGALVEMQGMIAENQYREMQGKSQAYGEREFHKLEKEWGLGHNTVITNLNIHLG